MRTRAVFARIVRRQNERCLRKIELVGDGLHLSARKTARIGNDRERIAAELPVGEDIDRLKLNLHLSPPPAWRSMRLTAPGSSNRNVTGRVTTARA